MRILASPESPYLLPTIAIDGFEPGQMSSELPIVLAEEFMAAPHVVITETVPSKPYISRASFTTIAAGQGELKKVATSGFNLLIDRAQTLRSLQYEEQIQVLPWMGDAWNKRPDRLSTLMPGLFAEHPDGSKPWRHNTTDYLNLVSLRTVLDYANNTASNDNSAAERKAENRRVKSVLGVKFTPTHARIYRRVIREVFPAGSTTPG